MQMVGGPRRWCLLTPSWVRPGAQVGPGRLPPRHHLRSPPGLARVAPHHPPRRRLVARGEGRPLWGLGKGAGLRPTRARPPHQLSASRRGVHSGPAPIGQDRNPGKGRTANLAVSLAIPRPRHLGILQTWRAPLEGPARPVRCFGLGGQFGRSGLRDTLGERRLLLRPALVFGGVLGATSSGDSPVGRSSWLDAGLSSVPPRGQALCGAPADTWGRWSTVRGWR